MTLSSRARLLVLVVLTVVVQACSMAPTGEDLLDDRLRRAGEPTAGAIDKRETMDRVVLRMPRRAAEEKFDGFAKPGNDLLTGSLTTTDEPGFDRDSEDITLNLVGVSIAQAAKSILGDIFEVDYSVDSRVTGVVTLQTPNPISRRQLLELFEASLRGNSAGIVATGDTYRIVPIAEAARTIAPIETGPSDADQPGIRSYLVSLRYVSADEMKTILEPLLPPGTIVNSDVRRNALIVSGTPREVAMIKETIDIFDVDWMKGMSFALVPVKSSSPAAIVQDLEQIFETRSGPLKGIIKFVPNRRLKSILVISSRAKYLREAAQWIRKIDVIGESSEQSLHVYHVQNRNASDLARVLESVLETSGLGSAGIPEGRVAPKLPPAAIASGQAAEGESVVGPEALPNGIDDPSDQPDSPELAGGSHGRQVRIVADDANNSLLIYCSTRDFDRIKSVLTEIDTVPNQVLLEAVIAEVSLDDDLRFGVRWFFGENDNHGTFSDAATGAVSSVFPGFSYFLKANDVSLALNALSSVTNVRVLSAPSLVVLDNKMATLQVGDQVPIVTQSAKPVSAGDAPIVSNIELKDTGVILKVTPRVNDSGMVTLDIEQEVSTVIKTTTSGIDSPTIRQRKMKTSVVVSDSEALALGGLIQERETTGKTKVPVLGDVPVLGTAFRQKSDTVSRTELIIFIRPRVIRDLEEARQVTEEFRKELSIRAPRVRRGDPQPGDELLRIVN